MNDLIIYLTPRILILAALVCIFYGIHLYFRVTDVCKHGKSRKRYCYYCELSIDSDLDDKW